MIKPPYSAENIRFYSTQDQLNRRIIKNVRSISTGHYNRAPNWKLANYIFSVGDVEQSKILCRNAGLDPDGMS